MLRRLFGRDAPTPVWPSDPVAAIDAVLAYLAAGGAVFAIFTVNRKRNWYVQVSAGPKGLVAEAVGDRYLDDGSKLTMEAADTLTTMGWVEETGSGNWTKFFDDWPGSGSARVAETLAEALEAYGWIRSDPLAIETGT